jgi:hypothetical protein
MDKIDILTFLWFIANHDQEDILDLELEGLVNEWELITDEIVQVYVERRVE